MSGQGHSSDPKKGQGKDRAQQLSSSAGVLSSEDDVSLMDRVRSDDTRAFEVLYQRYRGPILNYVLQMARSRGVAEEITQEVFMRVYRARASYQAKSKFTTWLWTIARNCTLDHLRKKSEVLLATNPDDRESPIDRLEAPLSDTEEARIEQARKEQIEECMQELSENQREALTLRTVSELSYQEIAETMKTSLACVKSHIHRAKNTLMDCIQKGRHNG